MPPGGGPYIIPGGGPCMPGGGPYIAPGGGPCIPIPGGCCIGG